MLQRTIVQQIPSTCFTLKFDNFHDYCQVEKQLDTPYYQHVEEFNIFCFRADHLEIDIEVANSAINVFINHLKHIEGLESDFIMTTDLTKAPEYTFTTDRKVIEAKESIESEAADEVER